VTIREALDKALVDLSEDQLRELLDFARFLNWQDERECWQRFGKAQLAKAYGPDEPEYSELDVKSEE